jgi:hypothetical protein
MSLQDGLKRRSRVWPRGRGGIVLISPERRCFASADSGDDRRRVEWITSWTPHGSPHRFSSEAKSNGRARVYRRYFDGISLINRSDDDRGLTTGRAGRRANESGLLSNARAEQRDAFVVQATVWTLRRSQPEVDLRLFSRVSLTLPKMRFCGPNQSCLLAFRQCAQTKPPAQVSTQKT